MFTCVSTPPHSGVRRKEAREKENPWPFAPVLKMVSPLKSKVCTAATICQFAIRQ